MFGKVYKIIANQGDEVYVGSTMGDLQVRFSKHKTAFKLGITKCTVHKLFQKYGPNGLEIVLVAQYLVCDRAHLRAYEQLWINKLNCVNSAPAIAFLFRKMKKKEYHKRYNKKNEKRVKATLKKRRGQIIKCDCGMYMNRSSLTRHQNRNKCQQVIENSTKPDFVRCCCGVVIHKYRYKRHLTTDIHKKMVEHINSL